MPAWLTSPTILLSTIWTSPVVGGGFANLWPSTVASHPLHPSSASMERKRCVCVCVCVHVCVYVYVNLTDLCII